MHFEYEIGADEYVTSRVLYLKLSSGRKRYRNAAIWILSGLLFIVVALIREDFRWDDFFSIRVALWWLYAGFQNRFPEAIIGSTTNPLP